MSRIWPPRHTLAVDGLIPISAGMRPCESLCLAGSLLECLETNAPPVESLLGGDHRKAGGK